MSWFSSISHWFTGTPPASPASRSFDPAAFIKMCEDDPAEARAMLAADQSMLAREIERTFEAYDERLKDLAGRVHNLTPKEFKREAKTIREAQDGLRRALRRLEVSAKTAKELKRELADWDDREDETPLHADHPTFRSEIIQSELRSRGVDVGAKDRFCSAAVDLPEVVAEQSHVPDRNAILWLTHDETGLHEVAPVVLPPAEKVEPLTMPEVEYLLTAIREATREAERWHGVPEDEHDEETLLQMHHLRDLHAVLKRLDREQGTSRDRLDLAICPRDLH